MKKIFIYISVLMLLVFTSCEDELDSRHLNPDKFTDAKIEYLYSQGLVRTIDNDYNDFYNYVFRLFGTYTQTVSRKTGTSRSNVYLIQDDKGRWDRYYVYRMKEFAEMDKKYNYVLSETEKKDYTPYMETAKVLKAFNTMMATDMMGSMPYSEAWGSRDALYGQPVNLTPKYESQQQLYNYILSDLESVAAYLKSASLDQSIEVQSIFPKQDDLYKGDFSKWGKFTNSLRLRAAMRISYVDEAKAKEVLSKLGEADLITSNADNAYTKLNTGLAGNGKGIWRALRESQNQNNGEFAYAPENMVKIFNEANDPRLVVYFQPPSDLSGNVVHPDKPILGYPESADKAEQIILEKTAQEIRDTYGIVNSVTIRNNQYFPNGIGITASDVYFLLAEARVRNLISWGTAEEFYNKGIILSIQEYYDYYKNSTETKMKLESIASRDVSEATLSTWLASSAYKFDASNQSKALEQIARQRWIHLWILQPFENWAEYRRTDLPLMVDDTDKGVVVNQGNAPTKLMYPSNESTLNGENFKAVIQENDPKTRVWWDVK
ncbi:MAG: SusD/RagB family nutrient-binding outer membrane lipoprotein [Dysgonomonas sp.]|nr:SusD/RagB family nutrient-binding outer membrane lipoprotein [Dysgonomonas sp.]